MSLDITLSVPLLPSENVKGFVKEIKYERRIEGNLKTHWAKFNVAPKKEKSIIIGDGLGHVSSGVSGKLVLTVEPVEEPMIVSIQETSHIKDRVAKYTEDLSIFNFHPRNRKIEESRLRTLRPKLKNGWNSDEHLICIDIEGKLYVGNGQHRLTIAREQKLGVWYKVSEEKDVVTFFNKIVELNSTNPSWSIENFLEHHALDSTTYKKIHELSLRFKLPVMVLVSLLVDGCDERTLRDEFKEGTLRINDDKFTTVKIIASQINDIRNYSPSFKVFSNNKLFLRPLGNLICHPKYNHEHMVEKLKVATDRLTGCATTAGYATCLLNIYNLHLRGKGTRKTKAILKPIELHEIVTLRRSTETGS